MNFVRGQLDQSILIRGLSDKRIESSVTGRVPSVGIGRATPAGGRVLADA